MKINLQYFSERAHAVIKILGLIKVMQGFFLGLEEIAKPTSKTSLGLAIVLVIMAITLMYFYIIKKDLAE